MYAENTYKNLILTNHARERINSRSVTVDAVHRVIEAPDSVERLDGGKTKFIRTIGGRLMHVVAQQKYDTHQWIVISVWVRGENDKTPLSWVLITLPFKIIWTLLMVLGGLVKRYIFKMYPNQQNQKHE